MYDVSATKFELKSTTADGTFEGYASVFNNMDQGWDVIMPGAFAKTLATHKANKTLPVMLFGHKHSELPIGKWLSMEEDEHGLKVVGQLVLGVQKAREVHELLKANALDGMSIGYQTIDSDYTQAGVRVLKEIALHEISVVPLPMNEQARVTAVKSFSRGEVPAKRVIEHLLRDAGMSQSQAKALLSGGYSVLRDVDEDGDADTLQMLKSLTRKLKNA